MSTPNRTITPSAALAGVVFAGLGVAFFAAARSTGYELLPAALMTVLLAGGGWFGLHALSSRPTQRPVRRSAHVLLWMSLLLLLVGVAVLALRPDPAAGSLTMQSGSGCRPLVGVVIYWHVMARKRAAEA